MLAETYCDGMKFEKILFRRAVSCKERLEYAKNGRLRTIYRQDTAAQLATASSFNGQPLRYGQDYFFVNQDGTRFFTYADLEAHFQTSCTHPVTQERVNQVEKVHLLQTWEALLRDQRS